jgi:hypothetical protein
MLCCTYRNSTVPLIGRWEGGDCGGELTDSSEPKVGSGVPVEERNSDGPCYLRCRWKLNCALPHGIIGEVLPLPGEKLGPQKGKFRLLIVDLMLILVMLDGVINQ